MLVHIWGGDGYLGWPTAMHLSALGHDVVVIDNYSRRNICESLGIRPLYALPSLADRCQAWYEVSGKTIKYEIGDLSKVGFVNSLFGQGNECINEHRAPDAVIHYAEQPSAPYSLSSHEAANYTVSNNLLVTNNLMFCVKKYSPKTHIIKLGTMGEYGTPNIDIEEGWLDVTHKGRSQRFLFPRQASSVYHTTKVMDTDLLWFGVRTWGLAVTDLMQGPVYGMETAETALDKRLATIFNYDELFGTVLNRFLVQAAVGYPLTVYGAGGQTRGYLNIKDTLQCVTRSLEVPAKPGELRIFNQIMETFSVGELAERVRESGARLGINVNVQSVENPRKEAEEHYYNPTYQGLQDIGVKPNYLTDGALDEMLATVINYTPNVDKEIIFRGVKW